MERKDIVDEKRIKEVMPFLLDFWQMHPLPDLFYPCPERRKNLSYYRVKIDGLYSYMDECGELIGEGKMWFRDAEPFFKGSFFKGVAKVRRGSDGKWTLLFEDMTFLGNGNSWWKRISYPEEDFRKGRCDISNGAITTVQREDGKWSYIDMEGKFIWNDDAWFNWIGPLGSDGFSIHVKREDNMVSCVDIDGKLIWVNDAWFKQLGYFNRDGFAKVVLDDDKEMMIDKDGNLHELKEIEENNKED